MTGIEVPSFVLMMSLLRETIQNRERKKEVHGPDQLESQRAHLLVLCYLDGVLLPLGLSLRWIQGAGSLDAMVLLNKQRTADLDMSGAL